MLSALLNKTFPSFLQFKASEKLFKISHVLSVVLILSIAERTIQIAREETCCHHIGYSFRLTARVLLYAPSHRQDSTYHSLCYTSCGALAGMRNSSMVVFQSWEWILCPAILFLNVSGGIVFGCKKCPGIRN